METHDRNPPTVYASRLLDLQSKKKYSITQLEALIIVWALQKFYYTIFGYPIEVPYDH